jgi:hypothetical protein
MLLCLLVLQYAPLIAPKKKNISINIIIRGDRKLMYYSNEFIDELETKVQLDKVMYANIQAHNVAKMLADSRAIYKMFGVYWWNVKEALKNTSITKNGTAAFRTNRL